MFPDVACELLPNRFPHYALTAAQSAQSDFVGLRVYVCLGVTCHLHFCQNDRWSFTCHCCNTGVEWALHNSKHAKLTLEKKILPMLLPGFKLATFRSGVRQSYQQAILAPHKLFQLPALRIEDAFSTHNIRFISHTHSYTHTHSHTLTNLNPRQRCWWCKLEGWGISCKIVSNH